MASVRALSTGYVGGVVRETGEVFEWPEGVPLGRWVEAVAQIEPAKVKARSKAAAAPVARPEPEAAGVINDAPAPVVGNGVDQELGKLGGQPRPDWIAPE
jgi:hypothetical protein